ncbi:MAG: OmpA family protein [Wenzhouxiangellaceae bacterium]|nr:OmpA family protein [Wenzhouxiangellaceae bacterium]
MIRQALMIAALSLASASAFSQDTVFDDRWYVGVKGGGARLGDDRLTDSLAPYFGAYIGRYFSPDFSLDLQLDTYSTEFDSDDIGIPAGRGDDFDIFSYGVFGRYYFGAEARERIYGLAGIGIQEHDSFLDDGRDIFASLGLGVLSKLTPNLGARLEFEARYDNDRETRDSSSGFFDLIASVGLNYSFGQPPAAPTSQAPPAREPAPARPAAPRPAPPAPAPVREVVAEFDSAVTFAFDSARIRPEAEDELDRAAKILSVRDEIILIEVAGHTDDIGPDSYNQQLSVRRAQAVADYLAAKGISRDRMEVRGYGEARPRVANTSPENRARNRRVVLTVLERNGN